MTDLYDTDYWTWTRAQAEALKRRSGNELDWDHLAEELDALGASEERELKSRFTVLLAHLLKWAHQPDRRGRSWRNTIDGQRDAIAEHLARNPGLKALQGQLFASAYRQARRDASSETDLPVETFPDQPAMTLEQAKDMAWMPADLP